jgi:hypothetical protein
MELMDILQNPAFMAIAAIVAPSLILAAILALDVSERTRNAVLLLMAIGAIAWLGFNVPDRTQLAEEMKANGCDIAASPPCPVPFGAWY